MSNLNDAADGITAIVNAIDSGIRFFPEPKENHGTDPLVTGEILFSNAVMVGPVAASRWNYDATLVLSTPANRPGWGEAIRRNRAYVSAQGTKSIVQAIIADETLGGRVISCLPKQNGLLRERQAEYPDGMHWDQELTFVVRIGA